MKLTVEGKSGTKYSLEVFPLSKLGSFPDVDMVYVFTKRRKKKENGKQVYRHKVVYVGESGVSEAKGRKKGDPDTRLTKDHEKLACIEKEGATHIGTYSGDSELATKKGRLKIEKDLVDAYDPPCN